MSQVGYFFFATAIEWLEAVYSMSAATGSERLNVTELAFLLKKHVSCPKGFKNYTETSQRDIGEPVHH